jgi:protein-tyrosine phosphatase
VLAASRVERAACVTLAPVTTRRTDTLRQFGRLASAMHPRGLTAVWPPSERFRTLTATIPQLRGAVPIGSTDQDDLPDPVNKPVAAFHRCAEEAHRVVSSLVELIAPL